LKFPTAHFFESCHRIESQSPFIKAMQNDLAGFILHEKRVDELLWQFQTSVCIDNAFFFSAKRKHNKSP
jgi:hypothetical protein